MQALQIHRLSHRYGARRAIDALSFEVAPGEIFALLGPNGSGKTTLFRVLTTLTPVQEGEVLVFGVDVGRHPPQARALMGVVFQSPSLDKKLTVVENIQQQAALYGLWGAERDARRDELLASLGIADRGKDLVETLSGGLRRRVELAKGMMHRPRLLLLDEPSTGLDPAARLDFWNSLERLRQESGVTIVLTTHLLDEADRADRIAILSDGRLVALDAPSALRASIGGDTIALETDQPEPLAAEIQARFGLPTQTLAGEVRLEQPDGHRLLPQLAEALSGRYSAIRLGRPTLEDVFILKTGRQFWQSQDEAEARHA